MREPKIILIIEDSPAQAFAIGQLLKANGLRVQYAIDGQDGYRMASKYVPDAVILDLEMPRMDSLEALKCLQADPQTVDIPVVVLTQHADRAELVIDGINRGAVDFVPKGDFSDAVLLETLRRMGLVS